MTPGGEAEQRRPPGHVGDGPQAAPVQPAQCLPVLPRPVHRQGQQDQRNDRHQADPHHEAQGVLGRRPAGEHVGHAPEGRRGDHQREAEGRPRQALVHRGHGHPGHGDGHAGHPAAPRPFAEHGGGDQQREHRLALEHQRGEARRHSGLHADEQQAELGHPQRQSDPDDPPGGHLRTGQQEDRGQGRHQEAQRREQQRREVVQADVDHHEVDAPHGGDEYGEEHMGWTHAPSIPRSTMKHQRLFLKHMLQFC